MDAIQKLEITLDDVNAELKVPIKARNDTQIFYTMTLSSSALPSKVSSVGKHSEFILSLNVLVNGSWTLI